MKPASPELIALLASGQFGVADLYTLTLASGEVLRYTGYDVPLSHGGQVWSATGPLITRGRVRQVAGIEVDTLDITMSSDGTVEIAGRPIQAMVHAGGLDNARMRLDRAYLTPPDTVVGVLNLFDGRLRVDSVSRSTLSATVRSDLELLDQPLPRNLYRPGCAYTVFDPGCGLSRSAFAQAATVTGGDTLNLTLDLSEASGWADMGNIEFLTGANAGVIRSIRRWQPGAVQLSLPLLHAPAIGDSVSVSPGCDGSYATCDSKYNNTGRIRIFPFIPVPETTY